MEVKKPYLIICEGDSEFAYGSAYLPIFQAFCAKMKDALKFMFPYEKGDMPFALTVSHVELLVANNEVGSFPHSEFATFIRKILQGGES